MSDGEEKNAQIIQPKWFTLVRLNTIEFLPGRLVLLLCIKCCFIHDIPANYTSLRGTLNTKSTKNLDPPNENQKNIWSNKYAVVHN